MINFVKSVVFGLMFCLMLSCQNNANFDEPSTNDCSLSLSSLEPNNGIMELGQGGADLDKPIDGVAEIALELTSSMTEDDFMTTCDEVKMQVGSLTQASELTDDEAVAILEPLIDDGKQLKEQIVNQLEGETSQIDDLEYFKNLSDEECVALSFFFHGIQEELDNNDEPEGQTASISGGKIFRCSVSAIFGLSIDKLSVRGVISATTVRQALIAIGKRYFGYIGLAVMIYDFVQCVR